MIDPKPKLAPMKNLRTSVAHITFRGVGYTIEPESDGVWCWRCDDGVRGGFASKEAAATDARQVINERVNNKRNHANDNGNHANDNGNHANDNEREERAIAHTPAGGALASLTALAEVLNNVDTSYVVGRSGLPMLQFKRDGSGTWSFGQRRTVVEDGSSWAVNPTTFKWGHICFNEANKPTERLVSVSQLKPDVTQLPDTGFEWQELWGVNLKCIDGTDAGTEVVFKTSTVGGVQAVASLIDMVRDRLNSGQHGGKVAPIVHLEKDSYPHSQFGKVWFPVFTIKDWMPLSGPGPAPKQTSTSAQPRRRRVA
jgi:hypothetical protein